MKRWTAWLLPLAMGAFLVAGCGEDDSTGPGGGGDTTAPRVLSLSPGFGETGIEVDELLRVSFNEAMDQTVSADVVTLSAGGPAVLTWVDETTLEVGHSDFPEGTEITVTLGTGLEDAAGNGLAEAVVMRFWTGSSTLSLLASDPAEGATGVVRNEPIQLLFSQSMNLASVSSNTTIEVPDVGAKLALPFTVSDGPEDWVLLTTDDPLPASTLVTVTVGAGAQAWSGQTLGEAAVVQFTTGTTTDSTPPTIVAVEPANNSSISPNAPYIRFTFSEPINDETFEPSYMSAQLAMLVEMLNVDIYYSADGLQLTVPLPGNLPAGLRLVAHFVDFEDLAGNAQTTPYELDLTVSGTPDFWPFIDGWIAGYFEEITYGDATGPIDTDFSDELIRMDEQANGDFWFASYDNFSFTTVLDADVYRRGSSVIALKGMMENDGGGLVFQDLTPDVDWVRLPFAAQSWSGTTGGMFDGETIEIPYQATSLLNQDVDAGFGFRKSNDLRWRGEPISSSVEWVDCYMRELQYAFVAEGDTLNTGREIQFYAAGFGPVRYSTLEMDAEGNFEQVEGYPEGFIIPGFLENEGPEMR